MDAQHPSAPPIPDVKTWRELKTWMQSQGAWDAAIDCAEIVWKRYLAARQPIPLPLDVGITVGLLIERLQQMDPNAHVIKYHEPGATTASRVRGFSQVTIRNGEHREVAAIMLE